MMSEETNLKLLLISNEEGNEEEEDNDDDDDDDDEDEIFNAIPTSKKNTDNQHIQLMKLHGRTSSQDSNDLMPNNNKDEDFCTKSFKFFIINLIFLLNGATFCLFIFSRDYFQEKLNSSSKLTTTTTNNLNTYVLAVLIGILTTNYLVLKFERFHILMYCSLLSSFCLILMPLVKSNYLFALLMFSFGICFGFNKTVSYKWICKNDRRLNKLKLIQIQFYFGFFISFCLIASILNQQQTTATTSLTVTSTPSTNLLLTNDSRKRDYDKNILTSTLLTSSSTTTPTTTSTTSTTTTTKVHAKKPDVADGSLLEQSHITKPQQSDLNNNNNKKTDPETTSQLINYVVDSNSSQSLKSCLLNLNRNCLLDLSSSSSSSGSGSGVSMCRFNYNYDETGSKLKFDSNFLNETL